MHKHIVKSLYQLLWVLSFAGKSFADGQHIYALWVLNFTDDSLVSIIFRDWINVQNIIGASQFLMPFSQIQG